MSSFFPGNIVDSSSLKISRANSQSSSLMNARLHPKASVSSSLLKKDDDLSSSRCVSSFDGLEKKSGGLASERSAQTVPRASGHPAHLPRQRGKCYANRTSPVAPTVRYRGPFCADTCQQLRVPFVALWLQPIPILGRYPRRTAQHERTLHSGIPSRTGLPNRRAGFQNEFPNRQVGQGEVVQVGRKTNGMLATSLSPHLDGRIR
jgi:hypothetical protein